MTEIHDWLLSHVPVWLIILLVAHGAILGTVAYLILLERKIASWVQDRIGPNRVGLDFGLPFLKFMRKVNGFGQPLADGIKFIAKEDYRPKGVDKVLFTIAPGMMILVIIISIAALPWGGVRQATREITIPAGTANVIDYANQQVAEGSTVVEVVPVEGTADHYLITYRYAFQIASLNIGVLYILAALSLAVYGVVIGGWASNNKYSFIGGLRATANMISYEIPLGVAVLCIVVMYGTLDLETIVDKQCHYWLGIIPAWNVFSQPLAFIMFLICIHAEANRAPFDLAEAEQELVGGYHTEYSAMRFALFFLAEYAGMITTSAICVALFFGGWHLPWIEWLWKPLAGDVPGQNPEVTTSIIACIIRSVVFFTKTIGIIFVFMWVRWSLPRFRFDQLMMLAWRALIPISLVLLMATTILVFLFHGDTLAGLDVSFAAASLAVNIVLAFAIMLISTKLPAAPLTNRRVRVIGSRFNKPALPQVMN